MDKKSIGILSIATNEYINYWQNLARTVDEKLDPNFWDVTLHLFTSEIADAEKMASELKNCKVKIYEIPRYGWPEATLYRYRVFEQHITQLSEDLLMYLDADMLVRRDIRGALPSTFLNDICLVQHPGYYRPEGLKGIAFYLTNPRVILSDLRMKVKIGGLGSWETRREFSAYVPRGARSKYVCGGTWLGKNLTFKRLISELAEIEIRDTEKGLVPIWHDESILNKWSSDNKTTLLSPSFCYDPTYEQLADLPEYIRAVDKGNA